MNIQLIQQKIKFYCDWWNDLSLDEKEGWLGAWIRERIDYFDQAVRSHLNEQERLYL